MATISARPFRLALVQLGGLTSAKAANIAAARAAVLAAAAASPKPDLVVLPEVWNSPYAVASFGPYSEPVPAPEGAAAAADGTAASGHAGGQDKEGETVTALREMAKQAGVWLIGGTIPEREGDTLFNTCTVYDPTGRLVAKHRKVHLFDIDIPGRQTFKESDSLTGGSWLTTFDAPFGKIGLGICYDIRFPEMAQIYARQGCVAVIYPAAFNTTTGPMHWELLQRARAIDNQVYIATASPARNLDAAYHAYGHSMVVDPLGKVLVEAGEAHETVFCDIDPEFLATSRRNLPVTIQRRFDVYPDVAKTFL
ncbi:Omega-amidase nit3 [Cryptotrichosporon argae]